MPIQDSLWAESPDHRCAVCGRELTAAEAEVEHLYPLKLGGDTAGENRLLVCRDCHRGSRDRSFTEATFQQYLMALLSRNPSYRDIRQNVPLKNGRLADLLLWRKGKDGVPDQFVLVEVKAAGGFTDNRLESVIERLREERRALPHAAAALALPSCLPDSHRARLRSADIEAWDAAFIEREFSKELLELRREQRAAPPQTPLSPYRTMIGRLRACPRGKTHWPQYQKLVGETLELLFCPPLAPPIEQDCDLGASNRRDFILPNYSYDDEWRYLRERYQADYLVVDAKNSGKPVTKADILQIAHYLRKKGPGLLGVICSRCGAGAGGLRHLRDAWLLEDKMIVILNDSDMEQMLLNKEANLPPVLLLLKKIEDLRLSI